MRSPDGRPNRPDSYYFDRMEELDRCFYGFLVIFGASVLIIGAVIGLACFLFP